MKRSSKKGFTLAELLIVIAIIAVLVAIMIPVFGAQLDKATAAAELANVRAKYAEAVANAMMSGNNLSAPTSAKVNYSALTADKKTDTVVYVAKLDSAPTDLTTKNGWVSDTSSDDVELVATTGSGEHIYIIVAYKDKYMGCFAIDDDVVIGMD